MKTVVYQSYRTRGVAPWLTTCMQTVRHWAQIQGFEYRFFGDEFFDHAPPWFRQKAGHEICPVTDLARLVVAKQFLAGEFERAIWIDADVLIFQPSRLNLSMAADFALSLEVWVSASASGALSASHRVNNSVCVFTRGSIHLDFFIDACLRIAHQKAQLGKLDVGTAFFSRLREILPFPLLMEVGTFGPGIVADIAADGGPYLDEYARHLPFPIACANFCASLEGASGHEAAQQEKTYARAVARCLETQGAVIHRRVQGP